MISEPLRAGVIGLGVGNVHAEGYTVSPDASLVALCDTDERRLQDMAKRFHVPAEGLFTDYKKMLSEAKLALVSICLPNALHAEVTLAALNAGTHVLCEKPLAPTVEQAEQMLAAATRHNRKLMVGYNYRYRADVQWVHRLVESGQLGELYHVYASWRRETGIPGRGWFGSKKLAGGGALIDLGVHVLDLALYMLDFSQAITVSGDTHTLFGPRGMKTWGRKPGQVIEPPFDVDDSAVGFIRFEEGVNLVLHASWAEHRQPQDDLIHLELQGTNGTVILNVPNYRTEDTLRFYTEVEGEAVIVTPTVKATPLSSHVTLVLDVARSLREGTEPTTTGEQGLQAIQILEAIYQSAQSGHEIALDAITKSAGD